MQVYEITLQPLTGFGTPLKGDTIFGHFCWQLAYDASLCAKPLTEALKAYAEKPFAVFSSAYPRFIDSKGVVYALRTPVLPLESLFVMPEDKGERLAKRKDYKKLRWMLYPEGSRIDLFKSMAFESDEGLFEKFCTGAPPETRRTLKSTRSTRLAEEFTQSHNTINRMTGTTGEGGFAPYAVDQIMFAPGVELVLFASIDNTVISREQLTTGLQRIGESGFGRDASTGLGRFRLCEVRQADLTAMGSSSPNACYTLGPCVPKKGAFGNMFFLPFTRFGRHGDMLAKSSNPFKTPVIMADEAAILTPADRSVFDRPYIGTAVRNISKAEPATVTQGYSLYVPVKVEA
ncbi:MAG: hypothetical protein JW832_06690 [Deltaproteobacteria bacterium]|nr:hypothetical protein [Deltaproteobacteria bacterium]